MNSLQVINENFIVNKETGAISISQRKCAELLGVYKNSISHYIKSKIGHCPQENDMNHTIKEDNNILLSSQIDETLFFSLVEYYAFESKAKNETALNLYKQIAKAGSRAFLYSQAGYQFQVVEQPKLPQTYKEALRELLVVLDERDAEIEAHNETKLVLEDKKIQLDESMNYLSIKRVAQFNNIPWRSISWRKLKSTGYEIKSIFDANYGNVNAYSRDAWLEVYPDLVLPTEQST